MISEPQVKVALAIPLKNFEDCGLPEEIRLFFAEVCQGDVVLLFPWSKDAILPEGSTIVLDLPFPMPDLVTQKPYAKYFRDTGINVEIVTDGWQWRDINNNVFSRLIEEGFRIDWEHSLQEAFWERGLPTKLPA